MSTCRLTFLGIDITANRLFGPQPRTATYVCVWEIKLGSIKGIMSAEQIRILAASGQAFGLNFDDSANAPAAQYQPAADPDGMSGFLSVTSESNVHSNFLETLHRVR